MTYILSKIRKTATRLAAGVLFACLLTSGLLSCGSEAKTEIPLSVSSLTFKYGRSETGFEIHRNADGIVTDSKDHRYWLQKMNLMQCFQLDSPAWLTYEPVDNHTPLEQGLVKLHLKVRLNKKMFVKDYEYLHARLDKGAVPDDKIVRRLFDEFLIYLDDNRNYPEEKIVHMFASPERLNVYDKATRSIVRTDDDIEGMNNFFRFLTEGQVGDVYEWVLDCGLQNIPDSSFGPGLEAKARDITEILILIGDHPFGGLDFEGENIWDFTAEEAALAAYQASKRK